MSKPLVIDLFCGLGGWSEGFLAEGYDCIGFDIERHDYGSGGYPGELVLQDVRTLHGSQFKDATVIVASSPCQKYSYMAMPWSRGKAMAAEIRRDFWKWYDLNELFVQPFRIAQEAGLPLIVENVRGAIPWVGQSRWHYGSFHLWGDVPALMPITFRGIKAPGMNWSDQSKRGQDFTRCAAAGGYGVKVPGNNAPRRREDRDVQRLCDAGTKQHGSGRAWFAAPGQIGRETSSKRNSRKTASAQVAKIPLPLSRWIAKCFKGDA